MIKLQKVENTVSETRSMSPSSKSKLQPVSQSKGYLPRVNPQFIGIGHELERKRQQRRRIQQQEQTMAARVAFLQKQQQRTQKQLNNKRKKFMQLMSIKQRQQHEYQQKMAWRRSQQEQLKRLKDYNNYKRMLHNNNLSNAVESLYNRNHSEHSRIKQRLDNGLTNRKMRNFQDLQNKRDQMISINISKEKGKMKVDKFYKTKNKQHLNEYMNRIKKEEQTSVTKMNSIRSLQSREHNLKNKLEHSTLRASRMERLISKISRTIQTSIHTHQRPKPVTDMTLQSSLTQRNPASGKNDQVEQNIELNDQIAQMQKEIKIVRKRRRNKHANRYKQYEEF